MKAKRGKGDATVWEDREATTEVKDPTKELKPTLPALSEDGRTQKLVNGHLSKLIEHNKKKQKV